MHQQPDKIYADFDPMLGLIPDQATVSAKGASIAWTVVLAIISLAIFAALVWSPIVERGKLEQQGKPATRAPAPVD